MEHKITVDTTISGFIWRCPCGASGNTHEEHQRALEHGLAHLGIEAPKRNHDGHLGAEEVA